MNKKIFMLFFIIVLISTIFVFHKQNNKEYNLGDSGNIIGDVNGDGKINAPDYILIKKMKKVH